MTDKAQNQPKAVWRKSLKMILCALAILVTHGATAQDVVKESAAALGYDKLSVAISTPKANLYTLEPLAIDLAVSNQGQIATRLAMPPLHCGAGYRLFFKRPGSSKWEVLRTLLIANCMLPARVLEPGKKLYQREEIFQYLHRKKGAFLLDTPGTYVFRAEFVPYDPEASQRTHDKKNTLISNELTINVKAPKGKDKKAQAIWREVLEAHPSDSLEYPCWKYRAEFEDMLRRYPDSIFSDYWRFFVANSDRTVMPEDEPDVPLYEYYAGLLEKVVARSDFSFHDAALVRLAFMYLIDQKPAEALSLYEKVLADMPESPMAKEAKERKEWAEMAITEAAASDNNP